MTLSRISKPVLALLLVLAVIGVIYGSHMGNGFYFDDSHAVIQNPWIRDLHNIPRFFTDPDTSSVLPANRAWRPLVFTSLAIDYALGKGYVPFWFHLSTLLWFLLQTVVIFLLARAVFRRDWPALAAAALFGLHPVMAETVNYINQRAEVLSTLGVAGGILLYARVPFARRYGLYLLPMMAAVMAKPPALVFPVLLFLYIWLIEEERPLAALKRAVPALLAAAVMGFISGRMISSSFTPGALSAAGYRITQPLVTMRYFSKFFIPTGLSADTDLTPLASIFDNGGLQGLLFLLLLVGCIIFAVRRSETKPVAFGLAWFLVALLPTSLMPLAEVENDHRMYFAFVGLTIGATGGVYLMLNRYRVRQAIAVPAFTLVLAVFAAGAWHRCEVWKTDESLWKDTVEASPHNGRALMNYGLTLMAKAQYPAALALFQRALVYLPTYYVLEINLGIVNGSMGNREEAEKHFRQALAYAPLDAAPRHYYARWLHDTGRFAEAEKPLQEAVALNPSYVDAWYLLMQNASDAGRPDETAATAQRMLALFPTDITARGWLNRAASAKPTAEGYLNQSLGLYQEHKYKECIDAAQKALALRPNYPEAWNNIAAAYNSQLMWDEGIAAAQKAIALAPNYQLAKNNLAWAQSQKAKK